LKQATRAAAGASLVSRRSSSSLHHEGHKAHRQAPRNDGRQFPQRILATDLARFSPSFIRLGRKDYVLKYVENWLRSIIFREYSLRVRSVYRGDCSYSLSCPMRNDVEEPANNVERTAENARKHPSAMGICLHRVHFQPLGLDRLVERCYSSCTPLMTEETVNFLAEPGDVVRTSGESTLCHSYSIVTRGCVKTPAIACSRTAVEIGGSAIVVGKTCSGWFYGSFRQPT